MRKVKRKTQINAMLLASFFLGLLATTSSTAQRFDDRRFGEEYVVIFEDCDYRGLSREISVGEYQNMARVDFANDKLSSIRVPRGYEVTIYEDDDFRGPFARIDRDIRCFDKQWNDEVSSLRVVSDREFDRRPSKNPRYDNSNQDDGSYSTGRSTSRGEATSGAKVTGNNVSLVVFDNTALQQTDRGQWQIQHPRRGVSQFKELSRDANAVYLQNAYTDERVRIDLFTNDVTFITRDGKQKRYSIRHKEAAVVASKPPKYVGPEKSNRINSHCFNYRAYTRGGDGGLRFHGHDGFYRFGKKAKTGRLCHDGELTMEINKTSPATDVVVEIEGNRYYFGANEKYDAFKNTWYRKRVKLIVGRLGGGRYR